MKGVRWMKRGENRFYEYKDSSDYEKASFWIKRNDGKEQYEISFDNINGIMRSLLWYIFSKKGDYGKKDKKDWDEEDNKYMFLTESGDWNEDYYVSINFPKEDMKLLLEHVGGGETPKENDKNENKKEKKKGEKGGNINNIVRGGDMTKNGGCCNEGCCCCRCC